MIKTQTTRLQRRRPASSGENKMNNNIRMTSCIRPLVRRGFWVFQNTLYNTMPAHVTAELL
jgi:hypothetical protein